MGTIKRVWTRFTKSQLWRAWKRYGARRGNRLAGATSFFGFLSLFPLIVLAAAVTGPLLGDEAIKALKKGLRENLPGIGNNIDIDSLISHAGTIGLISGVSLLLTGLGWIDSLRASIRSMHELDDEPGNAVKMKGVDLGALIGLGLIGLIATGASSILTGLSKKIVDAAGLEGSWLANWGLGLLSVVLGILAGALLFLYMQTVLPRIMLPRRVSMIAALAGGILFYLAQKLGNVYVSHVIGSNAAYGTLALPLALLVWIYLMTRVIMLIAAWTKEASLDVAVESESRLALSDEPLPAGQSQEEPLLLGPPGKRYKVVPIPQKRADTVAVAAGAVLGATLTTVAVQAARAVRSIRR
jgi:membrane protein